MIAILLQLPAVSTTSTSLDRHAAGGSMLCVQRVSAVFRVGDPTGIP